MATAAADTVAADEIASQNADIAAAAAWQTIAAALATPATQAAWNAVITQMNARATLAADQRALVSNIIANLNAALANAVHH
jgi:hypothetical protein